ncbi:DUF6152 family protein [Phenylobacterium sp. LjRoot225]|uniref:DUF6152 family protein n=1 Tax=Phenylobacterium sp. LjRoot225 TaxID=3342285 RepID=UPI003ECD09FF
MIRRNLLALLLAVSAPSAAGAHHSFAMYDQAKVVALSGAVKAFQWTNPHAVLWIMVAPKGGGPAELWPAEFPTSPGNLARMGWSKTSVKAGDKVTIEINPLRDGRHGGSLKKVTLVDTGKVLTIGPIPQAKP